MKHVLILAPLTATIILGCASCGVNAGQDPTCEPPRLECDGDCIVPACAADSDCDDSDPSTTDTCETPGDCTASCAHIEITDCLDGDGYCPSPCHAGNDDDCVSLRDLADARGIWLGAMLAHPLHRDEPAYAEVLTREFNIAPPGAAFLLPSLQPAEGVFEFAEADAITEFAAAHEMAIYANHLVWHEPSLLPEYLLEATPGELEVILENHIRTTVGHFEDAYSDEVVVWNVANEVISACADYTGNPHNGYTATGFNIRGEEACAEDELAGQPVNLWLDVPDYLHRSYVWAREFAPDVKLYYNDYGMEGGAYDDLGQHWWSELKFQQIVLMLEDLLDRGTPVDGLGFQMHTTLEWAPSKEDLKQKFALLDAMGLSVAVTELEVGIGVEGGITGDELDQQAQVYRDVVDACLESSNCDGVISWCFTDRYTWLPTVMPTHDAPCLFDADYQPKPAYFAVREALQLP